MAAHVQTSEPVCSFFLNGRGCRKGEKCSARHEPKLRAAHACCWAFTDVGCTKHGCVFEHGQAILNRAAPDVVLPAGRPAGKLGLALETLRLSALPTNEDELKSVYRKASLVVHPDRPGGSGDLFRALTEAKGVVERAMRGEPESDADDADSADEFDADLFDRGYGFAASGGAGGPTPRGRTRVRARRTASKPRVRQWTNTRGERCTETTYEY